MNLCSPANEPMFISQRTYVHQPTNTHSLPSHKKQTHPRHADDGANDLPHRHLLVEKNGGRRDNEDRGEGEEGLRNAGGGVQGRQQRGADADERTENGGGEHAPHGFAVAEGTAQLLYSVLAEQHQREEEAHQPDVGPDGGGGKRHADAGRQRQHRALKNRILGYAESRHRGIIMQQPYLAEHQAETLAYTRHRGVENPFCGQLEPDAAMLRIVVFGENRQRDATQGDNHAEDGCRTHLLSKKQPSGNGSRGSRKGHEELPEARADVDVALHQAVVADDVADHPRQQKPTPSTTVSVTRVRDAHHQPKREGEEHHRHRHPYRVERQRPHTLRTHLRKKRSGGPGEGYEQGDYFTEEHGLGLGFRGNRGEGVLGIDRSIVGV